MINARACDVCLEPLAAEVTRLEFVRGEVIFLPRDRWSVAPAAAGMRVRMICPACDQYLREAIRHLASLVDPGEVAVSAVGLPPAQASAQSSASSGEDIEAGTEFDRQQCAVA